MEVLDGYLVCGIPLTYLQIKNEEEMRIWIKRNMKYNLPEELLEILVKIEMDNLLNVKMTNVAINSGESIFK